MYGLYWCLKKCWKRSFFSFVSDYSSSCTTAGHLEAVFLLVSASYSARTTTAAPATASAATTARARLSAEGYDHQDVQLQENGQLQVKLCSRYRSAGIARRTPVQFFLVFVSSAAIFLLGSDLSQVWHDHGCYRGRWGQRRLRRLEADRVCASTVQRGAAVDHGGGRRRGRRGRRRHSGAEIDELIGSTGITRIHEFSTLQRCPHSGCYVGDGLNTARPVPAGEADNLMHLCTMHAYNT